MSDSSEFKVIEVEVSGRDKPLHVLRHNVEEDDAVQVNLFDEDYTLAAATGFTIWPGSHVMLRFLTAPDTLQERTGIKAGTDQLRSLLGPHLKGKRIVELGSGIGLLGLVLAAHGAHVLMTDVQPIVEDMLQLNIDHNRDGVAHPQDAPADTGPNTVETGTTTTTDVATPTTAATTLGTSTSTPGTSPSAVAATATTMGRKKVANSGDGEPRPVSPRGQWPGGTCINENTGGTAACKALDWTKDVGQQTQATHAWETDIIIAAETIWLKELVVPFVHTIRGLLEIARNEGAPAHARNQSPSSTARDTVGMPTPAEPLCLLAYTNRGHTASETFAVTEEVLTAFAHNGCIVTPIQTEMVDQGGEEESEKGAEGGAEQGDAASKASHSSAKQQKPCDSIGEGRERKPCTIYRIQLSPNLTATAR